MGAYPGLGNQGQVASDTGSLRGFRYSWQTETRTDFTFVDTAVGKQIRVLALARSM